MKKYRMINKKDLNNYELEQKRLSYYNLFYRDENIFLCNNIVDVDDELFENIENGTWYDDESDEYTEIYQYYLIDESTAKRLIKYTSELIFYSNKLDCYVLGVTHFGTSWTYVSTNIIIKKQEDNNDWYDCYVESGEDEDE